jgi:hypothetical protein
MGETFASWREEIVGDPRHEQVERARAAIPGAEFVCADFTELELPAGSFDAVCSLDVFNHVPRELLADFPPEINPQLLRDADFAVARDEVVTFEEPEGPAQFQWVLAQA